jgi:hypothetical protein
MTVNLSALTIDLEGSLIHSFILMLPQFLTLCAPVVWKFCAEFHYVPIHYNSKHVYIDRSQLFLYTLQRETIIKSAQNVQQTKQNKASYVGLDAYVFLFHTSAICCNRFIGLYTLTPKFLGV